MSASRAWKTSALTFVAADVEHLGDLVLREAAELREHAAPRAGRRAAAEIGEQLASSWRALDLVRDREAVGRRLAHVVERDRSRRARSSDRQRLRAIV